MEREILFRGKNIDNGEWVYGDCVTIFDTKRVRGIETTKGIFEIYPETLGQYTSVDDCTGRKIFEGDIIEYKEKIKNKMLHDICVVKYDYCLFSPLDCYATNHIEVIGNIHDNPELLKGGK